MIEDFIRRIGDEDNGYVLFENEGWKWDKLRESFGFR
jgi:hypothetical protein